MRRRMYPHVDPSGIGGSEYNISCNSKRRELQNVARVMEKIEKISRGCSTTSISQTKLKHLVDKSNLSEEYVIYLLEKRGITVQEKSTSVPETTSETNATNNPKSESAAARAEEMKKKMAEMMDKMKIENREMMKKTNEPFTF